MFIAKYAGAIPIIQISTLLKTVLLNRIARVILPYVVSVQDLMAFFRDAWHKSLTLAGAGSRRLATAGPGSHGDRR